MSDTSISRLREIQTEIVTAASRATTRAETVNLRSLWGQIEQIILDEQTQNR